MLTHSAISALLILTSWPDAAQPPADPVSPKLVETVQPQPPLVTGRITSAIRKPKQIELVVTFTSEEPGRFPPASAGKLFEVKHVKDSQGHLLRTDYGKYGKDGRVLRAGDRSAGSPLVQQVSGVRLFVYGVPETLSTLPEVEIAGQLRTVTEFVTYEVPAMPLVTPVVLHPGFTLESLQLTTSVPLVNHWRFTTSRRETGARHPDDFEAPNPPYLLEIQPVIAESGRFTTSGVSDRPESSIDVRADLSQPTAFRITIATAQERTPIAFTARDVEVKTHIPNPMGLPAPRSFANDFDALLAEAGADHDKLFKLFWQVIASKSAGATADDQLGWVTRILDKGLPPGFEGSLGVTPISIALVTRGDHSRIIDLLLSRGAPLPSSPLSEEPFAVSVATLATRQELAVCTRHGLDPIVKAPSRYDVRTTNVLDLARKPEMNEPDLPTRASPWLDAYARASLALAPPEAITLGRIQPIHAAACLGDLDRVKRELDAGVDPNTFDTAGWTPLHWAAASATPSEAVTNLLIKRGAKPSAVDFHHITPLGRMLPDADVEPAHRDEAQRVRTILSAPPPK